MRRRFNRGGPRRTSFRRRRVAWQTQGELRGEETLSHQSGDVQYFLLQHSDNDFVENHPRFAKTNDVLTLRRILGRVRFGLYSNATNLVTVTGGEADYHVTYGLCIVKGDYDNAGAWTQLDTPDPREGSDEDDKWLFKNDVFLSFGRLLTDAAVLASTGALLTGGSADVALAAMPNRPAMQSNDMQLPHGSWIDLKTRRRLEYAERVVLVAVTETSAPEDLADVDLNWQLRMLTSKWS